MNCEHLDRPFERRADLSIETKHHIILELARIIADSELPTILKAIVGSYNDTLPEHEVLAMLKAYRGRDPRTDRDPTTETREG